MAIETLDTGTAPGSGNGDGLRTAMTKVNSNFAVSENAASKLVQASSADTTSDKVMLSDYAWRGAQLGDYMTYGGTANAITLTSANLAAAGTLIAGMRYRFLATTPNTGSATIAVDGQAAKNCITPMGGDVPAGFIDGLITAEYNGSEFVIMNEAAALYARSGNYMTYGGTADAITLTSANCIPSPALTSGMEFRFQASATNTGATTIQVDGGAAIDCITPTGVALPAGFIRTDVETVCTFDGADFVVSRKVESGSNANGEWTRWEDGSQIIRFSGLIDQSGASTNSFGTTSGTTYYARDVFSFPVDFANIDYTGDVSATGPAVSDGTYDIKTTNSVRITISSVANGSTDNPFDAFFMGKWY